MTDEELAAIESRNRKRRERWGESQQSADGEWWTVGAEDDIDALLAEVRTLQDPLLCGCGMPAEAHRHEGDGLFSTLFPPEVNPDAPGLRGTPHAMQIKHRAPADVYDRCIHRLPLHPKTCPECWSSWMAANTTQEGGS